MSQEKEIKEQVKTAESIEDYANLVILDPAEAVFSPSDGGYLNLKTNDKEYNKVKLSRALPYKMPDAYISVTDREGAEIGIIKRTADFPEEQRRLIHEELDKLYYCPKLVKILSVKDKMGYMYLEVETTSGKKEFALRDPSRNIKYIDPANSKAVQITDVDGNRYMIESIDTFDFKSLKKIEAYLI